MNNEQVLNFREKLTSNQVTIRVLHVFVALFQFKLVLIFFFLISEDEAKIKGC